MSRDRDLSSIALTEKLGRLTTVKQTIIATLWGGTFSKSQLCYNEPRFAIFLGYYERECRHSASTVPFQNHQQILDAITTISCHQNKVGEELREDLATACQPFRVAHSQSQNLGITLCLRLWLMINIRDGSDGNIVAGTRNIVWDYNVSVLSFVRKTLAGTKASPPVLFEICKTKLAVSSSPGDTERGLANLQQVSVGKNTLDEDFHIISLDHLADIDIVPTENLADHLYLDKTAHPKRLYVFRCGYFVALHLNSKSSKDTTTLGLGIFSEEFLRETRQTFEILFPSWNIDCTGYLRKLQKDKKLDDVIGAFPLGCGPAMEHPFVLSDFPIYGERLQILSKALNSSKPTSLRQLWFDNRNKQSWYTLWIAVVVFLLTVVFGSAGILIGSFQAYISWESWKNPNSPRGT
ncbi:hypothetical protein BDD12DRAFT_982252 [Trichophaea hybrida]|nr:hypothetical protein BDD12DRAFT_982252 [Trichophaea hybrida]